ncbi:MAG: hypothetical protein KatS3mg068_2613 [Candidatus Sericytochromatia bacterium]|nr:MAG: hypothetical protein KatS3mg068_2613 [Candidatus Sericytochromatia bacterium]
MKKLFLLIFSLITISCNSNVNIATSSNINEKINISSTFLEENLTEKQKQIVKDYAPIIYQATRKKYRPAKWDFITSFDFDNDLRANNNEENLTKGNFLLPATVYYALTETETHYFIIYSFYHPLDWSIYPSFIPFSWHENDMENIQIVVQKENEKVVILSAQAHLSTEVSVDYFSKIFSGNHKIEHDEIRFLGKNPCVYVESGGHGIYNILSKSKEFKTLNPPTLKEGLVFYPNDFDIADKYQEGKTEYKYVLKPIHDILWKSYLLNENIGNGKLMDGAFNYKDELVNYKNIPRFFDSDRLSGINKHDAGILPFAFSFSLTSNDLGVLFFNPAKKYFDDLDIRENWSKKYLYNPYIIKFDIM